jgi:GxxExxY protein
MEIAEREEALKYGVLTRRILGCAMDVHTELGSGFLESVYERALALALEDAGIAIEVQRPLLVRYKGQIIGNYYADIVVENCIVLELKAARCWSPEHEAQTIHYLKATSLEVGLMINFGRSRLDFRRLIRNPNQADDTPPVHHPSHP